MKQKLLPILVAAFAATGANLALASTPVVYGKINVSLQQNQYEQVDLATGAIVDQIDNWRLESNASRIGIKGDFDITEGLKAVYKVEYEVAVDDGLNGNGREFSTRNIAGGLQGSWGTILFGRHDTPLKLIQEKVDRFNDAQLADIGNYLIGENRLDNILLYTSPSFGGFALTLAVAPGEENGVSGANDDDDGIADTKSIALSYGLGTPLYIAIAHENNLIPNSRVAAGPNNNAADITRFVIDYSIGPVKLGGLYQTAERHDNTDSLPNISGDNIGQFTGGIGGGAKEQDAWLVNAEWGITSQWVLKGQYAYSETSPANAALGDAEATLIAVGVDYKLNKNSRVYGYYARLEVEGDSAISSGTPKDQTFGIGYDFSF